MELQAVLEQRYSCKDFSSKPLSEEIITKVLEAGRLAPTAGNVQPQRLFVVTKEKDLSKIDSCTPCRFGAPCVIIVAYDPKENKTHGHGDRAWDYANADVVSVLIHMLLKATDLGLGSCWIGKYDDGALFSMFPFLEDYSVRSLIMLGEPNKSSKPNSYHYTRLPLSSTVAWV